LVAFTKDRPPMKRPTVTPTPTAPYWSVGVKQSLCGMPGLAQRCDVRQSAPIVFMQIWQGRLLTGH
jgi:hypothetical protein